MTARQPARDLLYEARFNADLLHRIKTQPRLAVRILELVEAVRRDSFTGPGKPEPLKHLGSDVWSRRINHEHRLVYVVGRDRITFVQARYHYER